MKYMYILCFSRLGYLLQKTARWTMATQEWVKIEDSKVPQFTIANITNYFITRVTSDGKPANDFKNVNSHAYPLFKAGHIQSVFAMQKDTSHYIKCVCLPEMKKDKLYNINIMLDRFGDITQANCSCPAGTGPCGSCKHISALCYALEEFCRIKKIKSPESCTSQLQRWNQPRKRKLDACDVSDITFVKHEYGKPKQARSSMLYDPRPSEYTVTSESEIQSLGKKLTETDEHVSLLHLLPLPLPAQDTTLTLPSTPADVREVILNDISSQPQPISHYCIAEFAIKFLHSLEYTPDQVKQSEVATRGQRLCKQWQEERQYRVTASKFGTVIKRRRNHTALAKQLLYTKVVSTTVLALVWGQQHEVDALEVYQKSIGSMFMVEETGIYISDCGFLGASPDGIVKDHSGHIVRLVEVKCPYKGRNKTLKQMYDDNSFCCSLVNGYPTLKQNHDYYYQVQGQMAITGVHTCDFVVWTPSDFLVLTILA